MSNVSVLGSEKGETLIVVEGFVIEIELYVLIQELVGSKATRKYFLALSLAGLLILRQTGGMTTDEYEKIGCAVDYAKYLARQARDVADLEKGEAVPVSNVNKEFKSKRPPLWLKNAAAICGRQDTPAVFH